MNPIYIDFLNAFSVMIQQTKNMPLPEARTTSTNFFIRDVIKEPIYQVDNTIIPGVDGNAIPLRIFTPLEGDHLPVLLFFHGGGWAFGSIEDSDPLCRQIANRGKCIVILVAYRLAPENQFPKGLEDCYAATKWAYENAESIGADNSRIAVGGESCGANLAAAVTLMARDRDEFKLKFQLLMYPVLTNELNKKVYEESLDQSFITYDVITMFWNLYLANPEEGNTPYASPLKAKSLAKLPSAYILTAEFDPLHVEGEVYAKRLKEFNVSVKYKKYLGAIHSFLSLPVPDLPVFKEALQDIQEELTHFL